MRRIGSARPTSAEPRSARLGVCFVARRRSPRPRPHTSRRLRASTCSGRARRRWRPSQSRPSGMSRRRLRARRRVVEQKHLPASPPTCANEARRRAVWGDISVIRVNTRKKKKKRTQLGATQKRRDGARTLHSSDLGLPACREACTGSGASHRPPAPPRPVLLVGAALSRAAAASRRVHGRRAPSYRSGCGGRWSSPSVTAWRRAQAASTFAFGGARTSTSSSHAKLLVAKPAECTLSKRTTTGYLSSPSTVVATVPHSWYQCDLWPSVNSCVVQRVPGSGESPRRCATTRRCATARRCARNVEAVRAVFS